MCKRKMYGISLGFLVYCLSFSVFSAVVIDPARGGGYYFEWTNGLGQIDGIDLDGHETYTGQVEWMLNVPSLPAGSFTATDPNQRIMRSIKITDLAVVGDEFSIYVDGVHRPWTETSTSTLGHFQAQLTNLVLSEGPHTFTLYVTQLAPLHFKGEGYIVFSPVPEPSSLLLFALGLMILVGFKRRPV